MAATTLVRGTPRKQVNADPHPDYSDALAVTRFWSLVKTGSELDCWPWIGDVDKNGYGVFFYNGRTRGAHELALSFATGEAKHQGLDTCHSCDNPSCCNPAHLRFDTRASNVADMYARGREVNPTRLTDADVRMIRERRAQGARQEDLADAFGCSGSYISMIIRGSRRADAGGPLETERKYHRG